MAKDFIREIINEALEEILIEKIKGGASEKEIEEAIIQPGHCLFTIDL